VAQRCRPTAPRAGPELREDKRRGLLHFKDSSQNRAYDPALDPGPGRPVGTRFAGVSDHTSPVLVSVQAGRHKHVTVAQPDYDGHNFFELMYSEPVTIGGLAANEANKQAEASFSGAAEWGRRSCPSGTDAVLTGYFQYPDTMAADPRTAVR